MNNNQISNPKTEVPKGTNINDKDYMNSLLSCLKEMVKNYSVVLTEVSNETLYNEYKTMFDEYSNLQRETYELMFRKGWYAIEKAEQQKLDTKYQTLNQEFTDLNA
ncbi:MAG: spore coat protein [Bacilli bacterium]|nr:spore coat protein [Bacilli bacterium]